MAQGEFALTMEHLETALSHRAEWVGDHDLYADLADAAAGAGDLEALLRYAALAETGAERYDHRLYQARAHRAWGVAHRLAGEYPKAQDRLEKALSSFKKQKLPWQAGLTLREMGLLALERGNTDLAAATLNQALSHFDIMGAKPDVMRTRAVLNSLD